MGFLEVFLTPLPNDQRGIFVFIPSGQWPELFVTVFYFLFFIKVFYIRKHGAVWSRTHLHIMETHPGAASSVAPAHCGSLCLSSSGRVCPCVIRVTVLSPLAGLVPGPASSSSPHHTPPLTNPEGNFHHRARCVPPVQMLHGTASRPPRLPGLAHNAAADTDTDGALSRRFKAPRADWLGPANRQVLERSGPAWKTLLERLFCNLFCIARYLAD